MSSNLKSFWSLAVLASFVLCIWHDHKMVAADVCEADLRGLEIECMYYMHKGEPSTLLNPNPQCCNVIKNADIPCCCRNLNRKLVFPPGSTIEDLIDWRKVLHCFNYCGRPFMAGYKCGNFTVPPGPPPK